MSPARECGPRCLARSTTTAALLAMSSCGWLTTNSPDPEVDEPATEAANPYADEWTPPAGRPPPVTLVSVELPTLMMAADGGQTRPVQFRAPFALSATEVTQKAWLSVMGELPPADQLGSPHCEIPSTGDDLPVTCVSWYDAIRFVRRLSRWHGFEDVFTDAEGVLVMRRDVPGLRLPTEAEWETAARAGASEVAYPGFGSSGAACGLGNVRDAQHFTEDAFPCADDFADLAPVGRFPANPFQFHDFVGNVAEWVFDRHGPLTPTLSFDPMGPTMGKDRVIRGQSYRTPPSEVDVARRAAAKPSHRAPDLGFRVAATLAAPLPAEVIDAAYEAEMEAWEDDMMDEWLVPMTFEE